MQVVIEVKSWHEAHHLGCILADAEWEFRKHAETWPKDDEVRQGFVAYADFFKRVAKAVTTQAKVLNKWKPASS